jgi:hypothetical protein
MRHRGWRYIVIAGSLLTGESAMAQSVPTLLNFQGRLADGTNLVNGPVGLELSLFTAATGGTLLYTDSNQVTVVDGLYSTTIGDATTFGDLRLALERTSVFVSVRVNGVDLTPRERLVSAAYSIVPGSRGVNSFVGHPTASIGAGSNNTVRMPHGFIGGGTGNQVFTNTGFVTPSSAILAGDNNVVSNAGQAAIVAGSRQPTGQRRVRFGDSIRSRQRGLGGFDGAKLDRWWYVQSYTRHRLRKCDCQRIQ